MTVTVLDFYADWCGPCKTQDPILEDVQEHLRNEGYSVIDDELGGHEDLDTLDFDEDVAFVKVDVDSNTDTAADFEVQSIPTLVVLTDDGDISDRFIGVQQEEDLVPAIEDAV